MAGRRSNPEKLREERRKIIEDMEKRIKENIVLPKKQSLIDKMLAPLDRAIERKQMRKNPPPDEKGAKVVGFKKSDSSA